MPNRYIKDFTGTTNPSLSGFTIYDDGQQTYKTSLDTLRTILVDSGSHTFIGNQTIQGNLTLSGTGSISNYLSVGKYGQPHSDGPESLRVENSGSINVARFYGDQQYYAQINLKNRSSGSNASADIVITADNGTEFIHYVDLGINSSQYTGGYVGYENDSYLLNVGKDMYVGTVGGPSHPSNLNLFSQNSWELPQIHISGSGQIGFNTLNITEGFQYEISGSAHFLNNVNIVQNVTTNGFTILSEVSSSLNFANDSEAQAGNVPLGGLYRSGSHILIRLT
jgi:hypothetical protein